MAGDADLDLLKWSSQLNVTPPLRTPKLPGDKILLPQSALEQLLAAAPVVDDARSYRENHTPGFDPFNPYTFAAETRARAVLDSTHRQPQLPHPLTFRIVNPQNGRVTYAGIREFSAKDGEVGLSSFLRQALGLEDGDFFQFTDNGSHEMQDVINTADITSTHDRLLPKITVHVKKLAKGTYVRLRPLEAGYDPEDWKALLERHLRDNFTTLTTGELLKIPGGHHEEFRFLVEKVLPDGDAICIVDTDLEVDIEPLNEEQARQTLQRRLQKATHAPGAAKGSSLGSPISLGQQIVGQVRTGEYVDYELREWDRGDILNIELAAADGADIDLLVSPLSPRQRSRPRNDEHVLGDMSTRSPKRLKLQPTNIELANAEALYISIYAFPATERLNGNDRDNQAVSLQYNLRVTNTLLATGKANDEALVSHNADEVRCKNCHQWVPQRTLFLHENFCLRNNTLCPKCKTVFQNSSTEWQNHWHCSHDDSCGNDFTSKAKHDIVNHTPHSCPSCSFVSPSLLGLAHHRTTMCPGKLILCQFCHLLVPQQGDSDSDATDPEVLLSGLTPHELVDGARTTECHLCNKIIRLRDMKTHLRHHDLERLSRPPPVICTNQNCGRTLNSSSKEANDSLSLCSICFGPLYADTHDPEGKALRRRVERRYLSQMLAGCRNPWCHNHYCKTGRSQMPSEAFRSPSSGSREVLDIVRPLVNAVAVKPGVVNTAPFYLCTDEASQRRRILAETITAEGDYSIGWCIAAVEAAGGNLDKARNWLDSWAPRKSELPTIPT